MPVGQLLVEFIASTAKYQEDLGKAARQAESTARRIEGAFKNTARVIGEGLSIAGIERFIAGAIESQAQLSRLADRAGTTVEQLSAMRAAAHSGGVSLDEVALASARLSKAVFEGQDKTTKAAAALDLLGLKAKDLAKLPPGLALQTVAGALDQFQESAGKTGVEMEILGKSGANFGAFLKALAKDGPIAADVTTQMGNRARETEAKMFALTDQLQSLRVHGVNELLPSLNSITQAFTDMAQQADSTSTLNFWKDFGEVLRIFALGAASAYVAIKDLLVGAREIFEFAKHPLDFRRIFTDGSKEVDANNAALLRFYDTVSKGSAALNALAGRSAAANTYIGDRSAQYVGDSYYGQRPAKKTIGPLPTTGGAADDPARKQLEAALAALKSYTEQEKAVLANREQYLSASFGRGELSVNDYYSAKIAAQDEDLRRTTESYQKQVALIDQFIAHAATQRDKAQGEKEKVAASAAQTLAVIQAAGKAQQILDDQKRAAEEYLDTLGEINARVLELAGDTGAATQIRFDAQNRLNREALDATARSATSTPAEVAAANAAKARLDTIEKIAVAQAKLNHVQARYANLVDRVSIAQSRIDLAQQTGQVTELQAIALRADAAQAKIGQLTIELAKYAAIASDPDLKDGPIKDQALLRVEQMKLQIAQLASASDVLAGKFRDIFEGAGTTLLTDLISHTKSAKDAFLDFAKSIEQSISQIAAKNIAETLFGKGGALGGVPDFFAGLFGGKGGGAAGPAALGAAATAAVAPVTSLAGAATAAAAALLQISATSGIGSVGSLFGQGAANDPFASLGGIFGGLFASGGDPPVGRVSLVGEQGPELFIPKTSGTIVPNNVLKRSARGGHTFNISLNVMPGADRKSAEQAGAILYREIHRASRIA